MIVFFKTCFQSSFHPIEIDEEVSGTFNRVFEILLCLLCFYLVQESLYLLLASIILPFDYFSILFFPFEVTKKMVLDSVIPVLLLRMILT